MCDLIGMTRMQIMAEKSFSFHNIKVLLAKMLNAAVKPHFNNNLIYLSERCEAVWCSKNTALEGAFVFAEFITSLTEENIVLSFTFLMFNTCAPLENLQDTFN